MRRSRNDLPWLVTQSRQGTAGSARSKALRLSLVALPLVLLSLVATGCATVYNLPANQPLASALPANELGREDPIYDDDVLVALSFSGGGTRAAAFSFGVLKELAQSRLASNRATSMLDRVDFVSGVSGGSVTAAYFGLKKSAALDDFRERFLLQNPEASLSTNISLTNIGRAFGGGVNDSQFPRWLDDNLFDGATFSSFREERRPRIWINASDIYNRTPFVFGRTAFDALCSDLGSYRISEAVAASAAVPLAFAPIVLETYPGGCSTRLPDWIERARHDPNAQPLLKSFAEAMARYHDGSMRFCEAARWRTGRQLRSLRVQHRHAGGAASARTDDGAPGCARSPHAVSCRGRRARSVRQLGAATGRADGCRSGVRCG